MDSNNLVEVTDKNGWLKEFPLPFKLIYIGSDPKSDIPLEGGRGSGISARHIQLIPLPDQAGLRAINLGEADVLIGDTPYPPRSIANIADGAQLKLGNYILIFHLGQTGAPRQATLGENESAQGDGSLGDAASPIGLRLYLAQTSLSPDRPLVGTISVRNQGNMPGAQMRLELEGLPSEYFEMGSGPLLFPNAEKDVLLRLEHPRRPDPPAGEYRITIRATAPNAYPGQSAQVSKTIQILPYYRHELQFVVLNES